MKISNIIALFAVVFSLALASNVSAQTMDKDVTVIELTQTVGQFDTQELNLKPGKYQFRIVNKDIEKEVGFLIQKVEDKDKNPMETAVENSMSTTMVSIGNPGYTGVVDLTKGDYVYSCPLNPTPHYSIKVK